MSNDYYYPMVFFVAFSELVEYDRKATVSTSSFRTPYRLALIMLTCTDYARLSLLEFYSLMLRNIAIILVIL